MEIKVTKKQEKFLKKVLNVTDVEPVVQRQFDDWLVNLVETKYKSNKSVDEKIDELNT